MATSKILLNSDFNYAFEITQNTDLNDVTIPGVYVTSSTIASTLINSPITTASIILEVKRVSSTTGTNRIQTIQSGKTVFTRMKTSSGWSAWIQTMTRDGGLIDGDLQVYHTNGAAGSQRNAWLQVGNNIPESQAGSSRGVLQLFDTNSYYVNMYPRTGQLTANRTIYLPNASGEIALTSDINNTITNITRSGTTFTATKKDGTTFTFTQQDNNTWTAMKGATSSANGSVGYVGATPPSNGYNTKFWRADGTWAIPNSPQKVTVSFTTDTIQPNTGSAKIVSYTAPSGLTGAIAMVRQTSGFNLFPVWIKDFSSTGVNVQFANFRTTATSVNISVDILCI